MVILIEGQDTPLFHEQNYDNTNINRRGGQLQRRAAAKSQCSYMLEEAIIHIDESRSDRQQRVHRHNSPTPAMQEDPPHRNVDYSAIS